MRSLSNHEPWISATWSAFPHLSIQRAESAGSGAAGCGWHASTSARYCHRFKTQSGLRNCNSRDPALGFSAPKPTSRPLPRQLIPRSFNKSTRGLKNDSPSGFPIGEGRCRPCSRSQRTRSHPKHPIWVGASEGMRAFFDRNRSFSVFPHHDAVTAKRDGFHPQPVAVGCQSLRTT